MTLGTTVDLRKSRINGAANAARSKRPGSPSLNKIKITGVNRGRRKVTCRTEPEAAGDFPDGAISSYKARTARRTFARLPRATGT